MGILDDLAMGFGLKERTADYDARTAQTIAANKAAESNPAGGAMALAQARNPDSSFYFGRNADAMAAHDNYLTGQGYGTDASGAVLAPQVVNSGYGGLAGLLFSAPMNPNSPSLAFNPVSPTSAAIGPLTLDEPIDMPLPGIGMVIKALEGLRPKPSDALDVSLDPLMAQSFEPYFDMYTPAGTKKNPIY